MRRTAPAIWRWLLGTTMRDLRTQAGLTVAAVAKALKHDPSWVKRIEAGDLAPSLTDTEKMLKLYGTPAEQIAPVITVAGDARRMSWWVRRYGAEALPSWFRRYTDLEAGSPRLRTAQGLVVPGLLQTPEYATGILSRNTLRTDVATIHQQVALRIDRQAVLQADPPTQLSVVLHESALRHMVTSPTVMAGQIERLLAASELPHVDIRVMTFDAPGTVEVRFTLVSAPPPPDGYPTTRDTDDELVYIEMHTEGRYLEDADDLRVYRELWDHAVDQSLTPEDSKAFLATVLEDWKAKI